MSALPGSPSGRGSSSRERLRVEGNSHSLNDRRPRVEENEQAACHVTKALGVEFELGGREERAVRSRSLEGVV